jgi:hypothetical protein
MSTVRANSYYDASGGANAQLYGVASPPNSMGFRNRILNGDCRIDQRNAGASVSNSAGVNTYFIDRWHLFGSVGSRFTGQQSTVAPPGFVNSALMTSSAATTPGAGDFYGFRQYIEGLNMYDFGWGTANAQTVTLSFWVRSSITGTYSFAFFNADNTRSYVATYSISSANTWEQKTLTIAGDTTGTWLTTNGIGTSCWWDLGSGSNANTTAGAWTGALRTRTSGSVNWIGTNGATFYATGLQVEAGSTASPFERVDYGQQLIQCQRYFEKSFNADQAPAHNTGGLPVIPIGSNLGCGGNAYWIVQMKVTKRTSSYTLRWYDPLAAHPANENWVRGITACDSGTAYGPNSNMVINSNTSNHFGGHSQVGTNVPPIFYWTVDAEL